MKLYYALITVLGCVPYAFLALWGQAERGNLGLCALFLAGMADAASAVVDYFHGSMAFVNVMKNLSVDCDCCAVAEDPCTKDIGILASLDPVAVDQACIDLIYAATDDPGQKHFIERVESLHGIHTIECAAALGVGSREYELVEL